MAFADRVAEFEAENGVLRVLVEQLQARIVELERDAGRNSSNSSKPPSADDQAQRESRQARRARERGDAKQRRPGKQPGAPGAHLARVDTPDRVVTHTPVACGACGESLSDAPVCGVESRQVFDLPARRAEVVDHRGERRRCACGHTTAAAFPDEATAPACWGPNARAIAVYLLVRHHIPVARAAEILSDLCGAPVSTGWLASLSGEAADGLDGFVDDLKTRLGAEPVIHADETGARVAGNKRWFHVVCTALFTFLAAHPKRGNEANDDHQILPDYRGTLVSDRWRPYWTYTNIVHQICCAHLLRDLEDVAVVATQNGWAHAMRDLLYDANRRTQAAVAAGKPQLSRHQRSRIRARYREIVADAHTANPDPTGWSDQPRKRDALERASHNLAIAFAAREDEILRFTTDLAVPFTNNQAERDLRMVKLQQKISGTFRTTRSAQNFATIRSYIETGRKHDQNPIRLLEQLFTGAPWAIPA